VKVYQQLAEEVNPIPLAPLIDIVFLTLVFFMTTALYGTLESDVDIQLPTADTATENARTQGEIYINVRADGTIVVNDRIMDIPQLQEVLNRVATYFPGGAVIIRGDKGTALGRILEVLDCCRKADIQNIAFAAIKPTEETTGTPSASGG